ncbi:MAG: aminotransferase family protein [Candidatus Bathyanammoxibius sp.]
MAAKKKGLGQDEARELRDKAAESMWLASRPASAEPGSDYVHVFVAGEGCRITDVDGRSYIDAFAGLMYKNVGYGRKEIADAAYAQMLELTSPAEVGGATVPAVRLAAKLAQIMPGSLSRTFFVCGGSEANETAVKMAKQYQRLSGFGDRHKIIARQGEYHGYTHLTMGLGRGGGSMWTPFEPFVPGIRHISQPYCYRCPMELEYPDCGIACAKELERVIVHEDPNLVAAMLTVPISAHTPVAVPPPEYWPMMRSTCDKYGVLLIDDEVVCGFGRTGKMFGIEHWDVVPDIMTTAKGISSGYLPLGACTTTSEISQKFEESDARAFRQVATFGGLPACCAAAQANIEIIENEKLVERAISMGEYFSKKAQTLCEHPMVGDIRGLGLLYNIELVKDRKTKERLTREESASLTKKLREAGLITRADEGNIRFMPPLVITRDEIDESIAIMDKVIGEMEKELLPR